MSRQSVILVVLALVVISHCIDPVVLEQKAKEVLAENWLGSSTKPAPLLYPHQWSWDSAFISLGKSHYDQEQAQLELLTLFDGIWSNGMLPHIKFNPNSTGYYFPGPDWWNISLSPFYPPFVNTSGIIQPPVHAIAALAIYNNAKDRNSAVEFLKIIFPKLEQWHTYLYRDRQWDHGLVYIRHPWESGMDNSPLWDEAMQNIDIEPGMVPPYNRSDNKIVNASNRPSKWTYDRFVWLVELAKSSRFSESAIRNITNNNFLIVDVLFNTIIVKANYAMSEIANILGIDGSQYDAWAKLTANGMNDYLWDPDMGMYRNYDMSINSWTNTSCSMAAGSFLPVYAQIPSEEQAETMFQTLNSEKFSTSEEISAGKTWPIPSFDRTSNIFDRQNYWRGPVWINVNYLLYKGLKQYSNPKLSNYGELVKNSTIALVDVSGFWEYFDVYNASQYGTDTFSWTASLIIDLLHEN